MTRKEIYSKIIELGLGEEVKKLYGRNYTQVPSADLESLVNKTAGAKKKVKQKAEQKKEVKVEKTSPTLNEPSKNGAGSKLDKLIELLTKKRILLPSELSYINN